MKRFLTSLFFVVTLFALVVSCTASSTFDQVVTSYDEFKKVTVVKYQTNVSLDKPVLRELAGLPTALQLWFFGVNKDAIRLVIVSSSDTWAFLRCHNVDFLADDQPVPVDASDHDGTVHVGGVTEYVAVNLSYDAFLQLANSLEARGRICNTEFRLQPHQLSKLREFAALL